MRMMMRVTLMALGSLVAVATAQSSTTCTEVVKTEDVRELLATVLSRCEGKQPSVKRILS